MHGEDCNELVNNYKRSIYLTSVILQWMFLDWQFIEGSSNFAIVLTWGHVQKACISTFFPIGDSVKDYKF